MVLALTSNGFVDEPQTWRELFRFIRFSIRIDLFRIKGNYWQHLDIEDGETGAGYCDMVCMIRSRFVW